MIEIKIEIGGIICLVLCQNLEEASLIKEKYKGFLTHKLPNLTIEILGKQTFDKKKKDFEVLKREGKIFIKRGNLTSLIDLSLKKGQIKYSQNSTEFNSFLRILYSILLVEKNGLLLHCASLLKDNRGYLFCGKESAGKSTIIKISTIYTALTDEISIVKKEKDNHYYVYSTPFWGELQIKGRNIKKRIKSIYMLNKAKSNFIERLTPQQLFIKLVPNIVSFTKNIEQNQKMLKACTDFCKNVDGYDLHFLPNKSFWDCIIKNEHLKDAL